MGDKVIHPDHYGWIPGIECMDVVKHFDFLLGNVLKYCWRAGRKGSESELEDLRKAAYYLDQKIMLVKAGQGKVDTVSVQEKLDMLAHGMCVCGHSTDDHPYPATADRKFPCSNLSCDCQDYFEMGEG